MEVVLVVIYDDLLFFIKFTLDIGRIQLTFFFIEDKKNVDFLIGQLYVASQSESLHLFCTLRTSLSQSLPLTTLYADILAVVTVVLPPTIMFAVRQAFFISGTVDIVHPDLTLTCSKEHLVQPSCVA